jgi:hypothetical protein
MHGYHTKCSSLLALGRNSVTANCIAFNCEVDVGNKWHTAVSLVLVEGNFTSVSRIHRHGMLVPGDVNIKNQLCQK